MKLSKTKVNHRNEDRIVFVSNTMLYTVPQYSIQNFSIQLPSPWLL